MKKVLLVLIGFMLAGCASMGMPGSISERVSGFDNTKEIVMEPAGVFRSFTEAYLIKLGLYKTSKMNENDAVLVVLVKGAHSFADKESLQFNIDGEMVSLESIDLLTDIETKEGSEYFSVYNESSKRYTISKDLIQMLINAKSVWVKVNLSKDYLEGEFSKDSIASARPAFRKFYTKVWGNQSNRGEK